MSRRRIIFVVMWTGIAIALAGCRNTEQPESAVQAAEPAVVEHRQVGETDLVTITLTPEAEKRLGLATVEAEVKPIRMTYRAAGEVIVPPGQSVVVGAPVAGSVSLVAEAQPGQRIARGDVLMRVAPLLPVARDLEANARADVEAAQTRLRAAEQRAARAAKMLGDGVGSVRAKEDAEEAAALAKTDLAAARERLEQLRTTPVDAGLGIDVVTPQDGILRSLEVGNGQMVAGGTPLAEIARLDPVWVRTPVYAGDLSSLERRAPAVVQPINARDPRGGRRAVPVEAPPTADPFAATTDLYFELANADLSLRPGQKVSVTVSMRGKGECLQVPYAALLYDINGGTWMYEQIEPHVFSRRRVLVEAIQGDTVCIAQGLQPGVLVVTDAAAELFGTEFGGGH